MIEVKECSKAFGTVKAVNKATLDVGVREVFGLVGSNGAGKSTLLRMMAGIIKPDEGEIQIDGMPVYENEEAKRLERAGTGRIVHSYTTGTADGIHQRLSAEEFKNKKNDFVTVTVYAGNKYGISASDIARMINDGVSPIVPLDIGGAISMKRLFATSILFCRSSREKMISSILEKDISNQEKMYRLLSLENEIDNEELCDFSIRTDDMEEAVEQVKQLLSIEKIDRK